MAEWSIQAYVRGKRVTATAVGLFNITPLQIWDILTLPEGAVIFRVQGRQLLSTDGTGTWQEQVVFTAPVRILFWKPLTRTRVHQLIDASDPQCITVDFRLLQSNLMSHLQGHWELKQLSPATPGSPPVTRVTYSFQMWPKGVPTALRFMPGLLDAVKGAVKREAAQLLDKVYYVAQKVGPGMSVPDAVSAAAAEVRLSGGSFKLLQQALEARTASSEESSDTSRSSRSNLFRSGTLAPGVEVARSAAAAVHSHVVCHALELEDVESEEQSEDDVMLPDTILVHLPAAKDVACGKHVLLPSAGAAADTSVGQHTGLDSGMAMSDQEASDSSDTDVDADVLIGSSTGMGLMSDTKPVATPGLAAAASPAAVMTQ